MNESSLNPLVYQGELSHTVTLSMIDAFLLWAVEQGASDVVFRADDPPWLQIDGFWHAVSPHFTFTLGECQLLTNLFSGQEHKAGNVQRGMSADFAYAVRIPGLRGEVQRFRVNVTASNAGHYLVLRPLPIRLPLLSDLGLEEQLLAHLYPENGLVLISGVMGSGKSTLLAGMMHSAIVRREYGGLGIGRQILTLEQPIEFDFASLPHHTRSAPIAQSEIESHVESWPCGVRSMTRRKGEIVMVGEARDRETLSAMLGIVEQGVTCYATVHAQDVPQTITRVVNSFPEEERAQVASLLKANLRLIIHQRLVPRLRNGNFVRGFGRIALREFLVFDETIRRKLFSVPSAQLIMTVRSFVERYGQSLAVDASHKYAQGLISQDLYYTFLSRKAEENSSDP